MVGWRFVDGLFPGVCGICCLVIWLVSWWVVLGGWGG